MSHAKPLQEDEVPANPPAPAECPPHHWQITTVRSDGSAHYHHECLKCHAQKDVPVAVSAQPKTWRLGRVASGPETP